MQQPASLTASVIFLIMAAAQFFRVILQVPVAVAGIEIPLWPSAVACVTLVALAIWLLKERSRRRRHKRANEV